MSTSATAFQVRLLTDNLVPASGFRLCEIRFKINPKTKAAPRSPNLCVEVPRLTDIVAGSGPRDVILLYAVEAYQDEIIREQVNEWLSLGHKVGDYPSIDPETITLGAISSYLTAARTGGKRLTGESIAEWFEDQIRPELVLRIARTKGYNVDNATEAQTIECDLAATRYLDILRKFASPGYQLPVPAATKVRDNCLAVATDKTNAVFLSLQTKLNNMINNKINLDELV